MSDRPMDAAGGEVLPGLWRFEATHPDWTEDEGGDEGWEPSVAWWAIASPQGLILVDPLVFDCAQLDRLVADQGSCAGIVRTCHWHQRSIAEAASRYNADVWATPPPTGDPRYPFDHPATGAEELPGGLLAFEVQRNDELALWLPAQAALLFGDAMLRSAAGELRTCPDSWLQPEGGPARLRAILGGLTKFPVEHVLVSHGPLVLGDGAASLEEAIR
ncbi:MAG: hypothetical protein ACRDNK_21020 [Solirubrobacteraceae bacterium]